MRKLKDFLKYWLLPPGVSRLWGALIARYGRKFKKDWSFEPLDFGLPELKYFQGLTKKPRWLSLNGESRPAVILDQTAFFEIPRPLNPETERLQLGLGVPEGQKVETINIFLGGGLCGEIKRIMKGQWHELRLPIWGGEGPLQVKVSWSGEGNVYLSHPLVVRSISQSTVRVKNIVCVIVDGITPDLLLRKEGRLAPNINRFFSEGLFCGQVYSQGNWTLPAFSSILTGLYPSRHGVNHPDIFETALPPRLKTLPEFLRENNFRTFAYSGNRRFSPAYGHAKGFERFIFRPPSRYDSYTNAMNEALLHLEAHPYDSNFIFLHLFDTHAPLQGRSYLQNIRERPIRHNRSYQDGKKRGFEGYAEHLTDEWGSKMYEIDCALGALFSYLEQKEWMRDALIVLTADHGTAYEGHGKLLLSEEGVSIPLLVRGPGIPRKIEEALIAGNIDLMPSVLLFAGIAAPVGIDGRIWPFLGGEVREEVLSESLFRGEYQASLRDEGHCYHYQYDLDERSGTIDFKRKKPVVILRRKNGRDAEPEDHFDLSRLKEIDRKLERFHSFSAEPLKTVSSAA